MSAYPCRLTSGIKDCLSWRQEALDLLRATQKVTEGLLGSALAIADGARHRVTSEGVLIVLTHTDKVDEDLERELLGAIVEEVVDLSGRKRLDMGSLGDFVVRAERAGISHSYAETANFLVGLPVRLLAVAVAVAVRDGLAVGAALERLRGFGAVAALGHVVTMLATLVGGVWCGSTKKSGSPKRTMSVLP